MWCKCKTNITFVAFKCRQTCLKIKFVGGQMWILCHLQTRGIYIRVCFNFFFKILQFLDSVCGLACSKVFNLSKWFLSQVNNCLCMMRNRFERQVKQKFHSWIYVAKCFIKIPAYFYNALRILLQKILI